MTFSSYFLVIMGGARQPVSRKTWTDVSVSAAGWVCWCGWPAPCTATRHTLQLSLFIH